MIFNLQLPTFKVEVNAPIVLELSNLLDCYGIMPRPLDPEGCSRDYSLSLLCNADDYLLDSSLDTESRFRWSRTDQRQCLGSKGGVVFWSPPVANWNPWMSSHIDDEVRARTMATVISSNNFPYLVFIFPSKMIKNI